jgi:hypothetical protein
MRYCARTDPEESRPVIEGSPAELWQAFPVLGENSEPDQAHPLKYFRDSADHYS